MKMIILLGLVFVLIFSIYLYSKPKVSDKKTIDYQLKNKKVKLLMAVNPDEWVRGLMDYRSLDNADGMLFIFPDKQIRTFWNKNTYLDLDVYWLNDNKIVGKDFLPSIIKNKEILSVQSKELINKVIEIIHK